MKLTSNILVFIFTFILPLFVVSQNTGFVGKKNFITIGAGGGIRLLPLLSVEGTNNRSYYNYDENSDKFVEKSNLLKWNLNASYKRLVKRNVAVGVMFDYTKLQISNGYSPSDLIIYNDPYGYDYYDNSLLKTTPKFHVFKFKPTITLSPSNSLLPMGINHTLGIGPTLFVMNTSQQHYYQAFEENSTTGYYQKVTKEVETPPEEFTNNYWGIEFLYSTTINYPVSKWMMIEFGYDLRIGAAFPNESKRSKNGKMFNSDNNDDINSERYYNYDYHMPLLQESFMSILSFRLGLVFVL